MSFAGGRLGAPVTQSPATGEAGTLSRRGLIPRDKDAYKQRNRVERMWCRLKDFRRLATRYDKPARNVLSGVFIAAALAYWLN